MTRVVSRNRFASAAGGVFFGLFLALAGGVFVWLMARSFARARAMERWGAVPCVIIESRVVEEAIIPNTPVNFRPIIRYRWEASGQSGESNRIQRVAPKASRPEKMEALVAQFPAGKKATCYQNPADPADTVLVRDQRTAIYSIWFPGLFVVGGLGIAVSSIVRNLRTQIP